MSNAGFEGFDYESNYHLTEKEEKMKTGNNQRFGWY